MALDIKQIVTDTELVGKGLPANVNVDNINQNFEMLAEAIGSGGGSGGDGSVAWADITDKPATFASTWATVSGKPSTFPAAWADVTGKPATFAPAAHTHLWADITDKPTTFTPATHTHAWADVTGKPAVIAAGATVEAARTAIGAGTSNLAIGTTATTAKAGNYVPAWGEVTGKPATFTPATHTHAVADVTGLQALLDDLTARILALETPGE